MTKAEKVKILRMLCTDTQEEFAQSVGVQKSSIFSIEAGRYELTDDLALKIAKYCSIPVDNICHGTPIYSSGPIVWYVELPVRKNHRNLFIKDFSELFPRLLAESRLSIYCRVKLKNGGVYFIGRSTSENNYYHIVVIVGDELFSATKPLLDQANIACMSDKTECTNSYNYVSIDHKNIETLAKLSGISVENDYFKSAFKNAKDKGLVDQFKIITTRKSLENYLIGVVDGLKPDLNSEQREVLLDRLYDLLISNLLYDNISSQSITADIKALM